MRNRRIRGIRARASVQIGRINLDPFFIGFAVGAELPVVGIEVALQAQPNVVLAGPRAIEHLVPDVLDNLKYAQPFCATTSTTTAQPDTATATATANATDLVIDALAPAVHKVQFLLASASPPFFERFGIAASAAAPPNVTTAAAAVAAATMAEHTHHARVSCGLEDISDGYHVAAAHRWVVATPTALERVGSLVTASEMESFDGMAHYCSCFFGGGG